MGANIEHWSYTKSDYDVFQKRLYEQLEQLKSIIDTPTFGQEPLQLGAELEMYITNDNGEVAFCNKKLIKQVNDQQFQPELNQYNIELNLSPVLQKGSPFKQLRNEIVEKTGALETVAEQNNVNIIPIGILPTLTKKHLNIEYMTNVPRYHNLANHLYEHRGKAFEVNINGKEPLSIAFDDICAEGANTSFQVHLMTQPEEFADVFNAAQLTSPLVAAISANSPIFLGHELWDETRIALFKQSLDLRLKEQTAWQQPTRVNFGFGWVRHSPWELFSEAVALYPAILPAHQDTQSTQKLPELKELSTHMGTLWPWHRPVYCNSGNGHIRIEFRAIPAGPTSIDMVANAAFAIGLAVGLSKNINQLISTIPFRFAEYNFYRAAQYGLNAKILWPINNHFHPEEVNIKQVIYHLLPTAAEGLASIGVDKEEVDQLINIIKHRLDTEITGANWLKNTLVSYQKSLPKTQACQSLVTRYLANCRTGMPVSQWEQPWL